MHRDITPKNILYNPITQAIKLIGIIMQKYKIKYIFKYFHVDFGIAKEAIKNEAMMTSTGTPQYLIYY